MLVSILHRITGGALTVAGLALLVWWLLSVAEGGDAYGQFSSVAQHPLGLVVLIGITWAWFQHSFSGIRHLFMDAGEALELKVNKRSAIATLISSALMTFVFWLNFFPGIAR